MTRIEGFTGPHAFLSNFAPSLVTLDGAEYPTVEHAFQAAKTTDRAARARIATAPSPGRAKQLGRRVPLRPDWEVVRIAVMHELLRRKFQHDDLAEQLLATENAALIEANTWGDRYWGAVAGEGQNWLGRLLELVRAELTLERAG
jgi:ribA/ribD-fused uncharacterized protein